MSWWESLVLGVRTFGLALLVLGALFAVLLTLVWLVVG
jgi:hypothetical protein